MRLALALALGVLTACTPDIAPGSYLCGPNSLCPEGQACNGPDNVCVFESQALPFDCGRVNPGGDDTPATGTVLVNLSCASVTGELHGCLPDGDDADFFQFDVPASCGAVRVEASVVFPLAFQPLAFVLSTAGGAAAPADAPCPPSVTTTAGDDVRCAAPQVSAGGHYALGVVRGDGGDCAGACRHNRYSLRFRLAPP